MKLSERMHASANGVLSLGLSHAMHEYATEVATLEALDDRSLAMHDKLRELTQEMDERASEDHTVTAAFFVPKWAARIRALLASHK